MRSAFVLLPALTSLATAIPSSNFNPSHSRRRPVPEPAVLPPGAAKVLRDPSKLKYEIIGIFAAYFVWLIVTLFLILLAKRLRRNTFIGTQRPSMTEMKSIITTAQVVERPPKSPSLKSPRLWGKKGHKSNVASEYSISSVTSVHSEAHEQQKIKDMNDLTKLYAAVMAHDEARSQGKNSAAQSPNPQAPRSPIEASPASPGYPAEFAQMHNTVVMTQSPRKSSGHLTSPMAPTPIEDSFPEDTQAHHDSSLTSRMNQRTPKSPMSFITDISSRAGNIISAKTKPSRISIRGHHISQPLESARDPQYLDDTVLLSPRVYQPGPAPAVPGDRKKQRSQLPIEQVGDYEHEVDEYYEDDEQQQYNKYQQYQQQQQQQQQQQFEPPLVRQSTQKRLPPHLDLRATTATNNSTNESNTNTITALSNNNPNKALPFRNMYGSPSLHSAPATKTTFLNRPTKLMSGPKTGGGSMIPSTPFTPYSPYMPTTPMTPITPRRLATKQDLKQRRKEERKKIATQDDLVEADESAWGA